MKTETFRTTRIADELRETLAATLLELRDPRIQNLFVTRVVVTPDLKLGKVYFRAISGALDERAQRDATREFDACKGRLRKAVADQIDLKSVPDLRFYYDETVDAVNRVEELLREIDADKKAKPTT